MHCRPGIVTGSEPAAPRLRRPRMQCTASRCTASGERGSEQDQFIIEVSPARIHIFDQLEFPCAEPAFQCPFALTRFQDGPMLFVIDQYCDSVLAREPGDNLGPVLPCAAGNIISHADIKHTFRSVTENVDEI